MRITLTGHRPKKLEWGYNLKHPKFKLYIKELKKQFEILNPTLINSGLALGHDMWGTMLAYKLGIPYDVYIPFEGQEKFWKLKDKKRYFFYKKNANNVYIEGKDFNNKHYLNRDIKMVNNCDKVLAYYNGSSGGTAHTVRYAKNTNKEIINIYDEI